ncbi:MAG TPA: endonuclease domain-containing protein [Spirochaetota bacterium]|nr:endonuclease domain-containing protein [Spirochaetota bacterium]
MHHNKKVFARTLRKEQTPEETKVWEALRNRRFCNLKFRRQHDLEGFIVDFYCHELRLAIEIDGKVHDRQKDYDELRQIIIEDSGCRVIRISNEEVNMNILLDRIKHLL